MRPLWHLLAWFALTLAAACALASTWGVEPSRWMEEM